MSPKSVTERLLSAMRCRVAYCERELQQARDSLATLATLGDTPHKWVDVMRVSLVDGDRYAICRRVKRRIVGEPCVARWAEQSGWVLLSGDLVSSTALGSTIAVLVPVTTKPLRPKKRGLLR